MERKNKIMIDDNEIPVGRAEDLRGKVFGHLTVLYRVKNHGKRTRWHCKCDCGNEINIEATHLKSGSGHCGCLTGQHISAALLDDLTNQRFGRLIVQYRVPNPFGRKDVYWHCKCDCGNEKDIAAKSLKNGDTQSCGCLHSELTTKRCLNDLTGEVFGKLKVLYRVPNPSGKKDVYWHCKCDCGNEKDISGNALKTGYTKSCGCLNKELASQRTLIDLTGEKFGKLTVLYKVTNIGERVKWHCKCDCGKECDVLAYLLTKGFTSSCGCLGASKGETIIEALLKDYKIPFETEKTFSTLKFPDTNAFGRFDFWVNNLYLIEFDGIQHYQSTSGWNTEEHFKQVQKRDCYKNQWCKDNNIPLIRIPYTHLNELCLEDLLLETSQFRVV